MYQVYIGNTDKLEQELISGLNFVGFDIKPDMRVFIKPNFTFPKYQPGVTTSPSLLRAVVKLLREYTGHITIGESDGGNHSFSADTAMRNHEVGGICRDYGARWVNLSGERSQTVTGKILDKTVSVKLPGLLSEIDLFVSMPVLKVHVMTGLSLSIKNLWGCYPDPMRCLEHQYLDYKLALICRTISPNLVIIDGTYGLDIHAPLFGVARKMNLFIMSKNSVAADATGGAIINIPLNKANHILLAEEAGLGSTQNIITNIPISQYRVQFTIRKTIIDRLSWFVFKSHRLAKLLMDSPLTPVISYLVKFLKTTQEKRIAEELKLQ